MKPDFLCEKHVGTLNYTKPSNVFNYIYNLNEKKRLRSVLQRFQPDIIHIHNFYHYLSPSILSAIAEYKSTHEVNVIMTAHDFHLCFPNSGFHYFKLKKVANITNIPSFWKLLGMQIDYRGHQYGLVKKIQWIFAYKILKLQRCIDKVISPSIFLKNYLDLYFSGDIQTTLLRNPFSRETFFITKKILNNTDVLKLVFVGRLSFEKGVKEFLQILQDYEGNYTFDIIGSGDELYVKELKKMCLHNKKVKFLGYKSRIDVLECMKNYDALVLSSILFENFPTVMLEGASAGLRLLVSNHGGMKELGDLLGNTFFFDLSNPNSVFEALTKINNLKNIDIQMNTSFFNLISDINYKEKLLKIYNK